MKGCDTCRISGRVIKSGWKLRFEPRTGLLEKQGGWGGGGQLSPLRRRRVLDPFPLSPIPPPGKMLFDNFRRTTSVGQDSRTTSHPPLDYYPGGDNFPGAGGGGGTRKLRGRGGPTLPLEVHTFTYKPGGGILGPRRRTPQPPGICGEGAGGCPGGGSLLCCLFFIFCFDHESVIEDMLIFGYGG